MAKNHIRLPSLVGQTFGRLTVINRANGHFPNKSRYWCCECTCGHSIVVPSNRLTTHKVVSCGCYRREASQLAAYNRTHGLTESPEYNAWCLMLRRCKPTDERHKYYSDRGITVCDRWKSSFSAFLADMGMKPSPKHSLDRINNDLGYEPTNCRWATLKEQARNKRRTIHLTNNGITLTLPEWAERLNIKAETIRHRVYAGCSDAECLRPVQRSKPIV